MTSAYDVVKMSMQHHTILLAEYIIVKTLHPIMYSLKTN